MVMIRLAYDPKSKKWNQLSKDSPDYKKEKVNGYMVVRVHEILWQKIQNIIKIRKKGWDAVIMIDGKRRSGKSTLGKTIAYLLDPNMSVDNIVAGLKDSFRILEEVKDDSVIQFDESSLNFSSKDGLKKAQSQLLKIIDVIGQKRLTLIFILPSFFQLNKSIAVDHSLFLIHVYVDSQLTRGRFAFFGEKKKKTLYDIGKKNYGSYKKPKADFTGLFSDFIPPYEEAYQTIKKKSLREALGLDIVKPITPESVLIEAEGKFKDNCPELANRVIAKGFGISERSLSRHLKVYRTETTDIGRDYNIKLKKDLMPTPPSLEGNNRESVVVNNTTEAEEDIEPEFQDTQLVVTKEKEIEPDDVPEISLI